MNSLEWLFCFSVYVASNKVIVSKLLMDEVGTQPGQDRFHPLSASLATKFRQLYHYILLGRQRTGLRYIFGS